MTEFVMEGFEALEATGELGKKFSKDAQKKIKLAARRGLTKTMESTVYGRTDRISERNISSDSALAVAARKLKIRAHHLYFRTFIRAVKVSSAKPYAASMTRANGINVVNLLLDNAKDAKKAYGFQTRKKAIGKKEKPGNMSSLIDKARVGGKNSGTVRINNRTYQNTYLADGSLRESSDYWRNYYVKKLGAQSGNSLAAKGKGNYLAIQKKSKSQSQPYPTRAVKIPKEKVNKVVNAAMKAAIKSKSGNELKIQQKEIAKTLSKIGLNIS